MAVTTPVRIREGTVLFSVSDCVIFSLFKVCARGALLEGPVAQWIRHRSTEPEIVGSSPTRVIFMLTLPIRRWNGSAVFRKEFKWPYGVTVSTLDSESSDGGSNPPTAFFFFLRCFRFGKHPISHAASFAGGPCGVMDNALDF